jgi:hypothetical protein
VYIVYIVDEEFADSVSLFMLATAEQSTVSAQMVTKPLVKKPLHRLTASCPISCPLPVLQRSTLLLTTKTIVREIQKPFMNLVYAAYRP